MRYKFWDDGKLIFEGKDFAGSPQHADDSKQTIAALLGFLSLRHGDTDPEYFQDYTEQQLDWAYEHGEDLAMIVADLEEQAREDR